MGLLLMPSLSHADAVAEVWGPKRARLMVYLGATVYIIATFLIYIATLLPAAEGWPHNDEYVTLFSAAPRIVAGSIVATLSAQLWDIYVFEWVKKKLEGRCFGYEIIFLHGAHNFLIL